MVLGDGNDCTHCNSLGEAPAHPPARPHAHANGEQDSQRCSKDGHPLHLQKLAEGKFQADRVHQQDDADFSQHFELVDLGQGRARGKGPDQKSAENISQDQRLPQQFGHTAAQHGGAEDIGEIPKERGFDCHPRPGQGIPSLNDLG